MPGLSKRLSKPDSASADQKRKNNSKKQQRILKRIRVIYSDPDATDSSSDDEQRCAPRGVKRHVKVIEMFESVLRAKKSSKAPSQNVLNRKGTGSTSKYVGVRQRKTGRWVAEIKDPLRDVRHWLGTFNTEEEAHRAYEKKRQEFEAEKGVKSAIATHRSPTSVLDAPITTSNCSDPNVNRDCNEREVETKAGETQGLDGNSGFEGGLKFVFDELKEEDFLMCNLGDLADFENVDGLLDLDMEDFSWLDEVLKYCGFED